MGYGAPLKNQNKGYDAQEKKDLMKMPGNFKQMSKGSWMSKHVTSPLAMSGEKGSGMYMNDMAPRMESPAELTAEGKKKIMASDANPAFKAAIAKETLAPKMHGALHMDKGAPTKMYGGKTGEESAKTKKEVKEVKANAKKDY